MTRKLSLDPAACTGNGLCADLVPELIELDEWGFPMLRPGAVGPELLPHAQRAVNACPTLALRLLRSDDDGAAVHRWA